MPVLAQDLRDAVLQVAMEGKLTEQLESDSSVDKLLNEIATEKERLVKEKIIKKEKKLAPITEDEIPFDIPDNWKWEKLGLITITNIGLTYKPQNISNSGTLVLRSSNIQNGKMSYLDNVYVSMKIPESAKISKGDVLICVRNGSKKLVGKAAIVDRDGMAFGAFMAKIHSKWINSNYIKYYVESHVFRGSLDNVKTETINQITQTMLKNKIIPIPPIEEQQRIVDKLNQIMPLIDEYEKLEKQLEELKKEFPGDMKQAVLQAAMEGKLTEQLESDSSSFKLAELIKIQRNARGENKYLCNKDLDINFPNNWTCIKSGECFSLENGEKITGVSLPYLEAKFLRGKIPATLKTSGQFVRKGTKVILVDGENSGEIFTEPEDGIMGSTFKILYIPSEINQKYALYYLNMQKDLFRGNKKGAAIPHLNKEIFNNLWLPIPPIEEQQRIVDKLDKIIPLIEALKGVANDKC